MNQTISILMLSLSVTAMGQSNTNGLQRTSGRIQQEKVEQLLKVNAGPSIFEAGSADKKRVLPEPLLKNLQKSIAAPKGTHLYAGGQDGNGGNMLICLNTNGTLKSKELLDFYESRVIRGITPSLGHPSLPYLDKIEMVLTRIQHLSPRRFKSYLEEARSFESQSVFLTATDLTTMPDSQHPVVPKNCTVVQTVIQRTPIFAEDKRYIVNKDIWDLLDNDDKAGLVLHEAILREAALMAPILAARGLIPQSQEVLRDSSKVRYINSLLASEKLINKTPEDWADLAKKAGLSPVIEMFGSIFASGFYPANGMLKFGRDESPSISSEYPFPYSVDKWLRYSFPILTPVGPLFCDLGIGVDPTNRELVRCERPQAVHLVSANYSFPVNGRAFHFDSDGPIAFYASGELKSACVKNGSWVILNPNGSEVKIEHRGKGCGLVTWDQSGYFVSFSIIDWSNIDDIR